MDVRIISSVLLTLIFGVKTIEIGNNSVPDIFEASSGNPIVLETQSIENDSISSFQSNVSERHLKFQKDVNTLFEDYWEYRLLDNPEFATSVGDHRYNGKLKNYSLESYERRKLVSVQFFERASTLLGAVEEGYSSDNNLKLLLNELQYELSELNVRGYLFPVSFLEGPHTNLQFLLLYTPLKTSQDYRNLLQRYAAFPKQVEEIIELMEEGVRSNMTLHERSLTNIQEQFTLLQVPPEESVFYEPFKNISDAVPVEEKLELQNNASSIIATHLLPSIQKLADYINQEYSNHTRPEIGVSSMPGGRNFYRYFLNFHLTDEVTPEEIHSMGLKEVKRIANEMSNVIESWGFNGTREEFNEKLRSDPNQYFTTEEEALNTYKDVLFGRIQKELPRYFKIIPNMLLTIEKVPEQQANGTRAFYLKGSPDGTSPGIFFLDTNNLKDLPKYEVVTLALHEGLPGHHLQISYAMEQDGVPKFLKYTSYPKNTAFVEGWALYSEFLGYEMGLYDDSLFLYGHLSEEIFRACRMVVDTGMHALGWTRQQAIDYMMTYSASTLGNIEIEVDRYITWPGQACSYKYGEMKIKQLRRKAEFELGDKFNLREFHDVILRSRGPMAFVEQQVDYFIVKWKSRLSD